MRKANNLPDLCLDEKSQIVISYCSNDQDRRVKMSIDANAELSDLIEMFERFLFALGYDIPQGVGLGMVDYGDEEEEGGEDSSVD